MKRLYLHGAELEMVKNSARLVRITDHLDWKVLMIVTIALNLTSGVA